MKLALVLASNTSYAPHLYHYKRILEEQNIDFDIIVWNKDDIEEEGCISYDESVDLNSSRFLRLTAYIRYKRFVLHTLKKNKYDRVVVFTIFLGVLMSHFLKNRFKKNYIFDIRDYSPILKYLPYIIKPVILNAYSTSVSSEGFFKWLPKGGYYEISHNYRFGADINIIEDKVKEKKVILTIGYLRDFTANKMLIESFQDFCNFTLRFVGSGIAYTPLMNFVHVKEIHNVSFTGAYKKCEEQDFLNDVVIMNILLGKDINSRTLMTNRFYLAISNRIPVIVNENSKQGEYVKKYDLGVVICDNDSIQEKVINYLNMYDRIAFKKNCEKFLQDIESNQKSFEVTFKRFIRDETNT